MKEIGVILLKVLITDEILPVRWVYPPKMLSATMRLRLLSMVGKPTLQKDYPCWVN